MIPVSDVMVTAPGAHGVKVSMAELAEVEVLLKTRSLNERVGFVDGDEGSEFGDLLPQSTYPDPERAAMVAEELDRLKAVIRSRWPLLTDRERDVMLLSMEHPSWSNAQVARALGVSREAVRCRLHSAREVLCGRVRPADPRKGRVRP